MARLPDSMGRDLDFFLVNARGVTFAKSHKQITYSTMACKIAQAKDL